MSPVVVVKDFGGYVNEYAAQTEIYRRTGREVRIHECHSACTMALGLPNVCVYKDSIFKFHQAYDPRDHVTNWQITDQLYHTYPDAIRDRLGTPTKSFTVLRGTELIDLGVRDCNEPQGPRIIVAAATAKPLPDSMTGGGWTTLTGKLGGMIPNFGNRPEAVPANTPFKRAAPVVSPDMLVPLPPEKPATLQAAEPQGEPDVVPAPEPGEVPLPPPRPRILVAMAPSLAPIPFMQRIAGSQPILPARFVPFPKRAT